MIKKLVIRLIPKKILLLFALRPIKLIRDILNGEAEYSYSQQNEDAVAINYFEKKWGGFYIDIGAFDPEKYSNTYRLTQLGWTGINIEPNPVSVRKFNEYRKKDTNLNVGVGSVKGKLKYYSFNNPAVNTFDKIHAERWGSVPGFNIIEEIMVEVKPLKEILDEYLPANKKIDLMSIDVEGLDLDVLKSNCWSKYRPELLIVENDFYSNLNLLDNELTIYLKELGYRLDSISGISLFFVDSNKS